MSEEEGRPGGLQSHCSLQWPQRAEMDPQGKEETTGAHPHVWRNYSSAEGRQDTHFSATEHRKQVGTDKHGDFSCFSSCASPSAQRKKHPALL